MQNADSNLREEVVAMRAAKFLSVAPCIFIDLKRLSFIACVDEQVPDLRIRTNPFFIVFDLGRL